MGDKIFAPRLPIDDDKKESKVESKYSPSNYTPYYRPNIPSQSAEETKHIKQDVSSKESSPVNILSFKHKKLVISIIAIVLALIISITLLLVLKPSPSRPVDIFIDFKVEGSLEYIYMREQPVEGQTPKIMPGDSYKSTFQIYSTDDEGSTDEVFVRIKLYGECDNNYYGNLFTFNFTNNWYKSVDGYMYYNGTLKANESIDFCEKITLNSNIDSELSGKTIKVNFVAECLQAGPGSYQAINEEWFTAPYEWRNQFDILKGDK